MASEKRRPVWAEVDLSAVAHNFKEITKRTSSRVMAIVKANAYGHGVLPVVKTLLASGADRFGVAILAEALELRANGIDVPIMIIGYTPEHLAREVVSHDIVQAVFTLEQAKALSEAALALGKKAVIHLKIDTGMNRIGFKWNDIDKIMPIFQLEGLIVEGIFSHFAVSDIKDKSFSQEQLNKFLSCIENIEKRGCKIPIRHIANSAAIIDLPEAHLDLIRPGIILYGLAPSQEVNLSSIDLKPVMSLKAQISMLKQIEAGDTVSYGRTFTASEDMKVATIPIGYADGYTRLLSNKAEVLIRGQRAKIIGRICMDQCMADVSGIPDVHIGDEVVLFGTDGEKALPVDELADILGTINYELVCMVSPRVPKIYIN